MAERFGAICDWLQRGVRLVSVSEMFDFSGAKGKLILGVLLGVAEMERTVREKRHREGIEAAKAKGNVYFGRKLGSTKDRDASANVLELHERGITPAEIASIPQCSERTVWRYLRAARQAA